MKRIPRINEITARALTDPEPSFVSFVQGGANQRPFRSVKSELAKDKTRSVSLAERWGLPKGETISTPETTRAQRCNQLASALGGRITAFNDEKNNA